MTLGARPRRALMRRPVNSRQLVGHSEWALLDLGARERTCDRESANERFSRRRHMRHLCSDCELVPVWDAEETPAQRPIWLQ